MSDDNPPVLTVAQKVLVVDELALPVRFALAEALFLAARAQEGPAEAARRSRVVRMGSREFAILVVLAGIAGAVLGWWVWMPR